MGVNKEIVLKNRI